MTLTAPAPASGGLARAGEVLFRWRNLIFPIVLLGVGFGTRPRIAGGSMRLDHAVDVVGVMVALDGQVLRVVVIGLAYITRGGQNRQPWANTLVEGGVFAHCRNPLYVGNVLILTGLAIVHGGWAMYLLVMPFFGFAYTAIVMAEEQYLRRRFGDAYARYCARVPRWVPALRGVSDTVGGARLDWLRVLRKEYGTPVAWLSGIFALLVWEHTASSVALPPGELRFIGLTWGILAVAYLVTMRLKLRGSLGRV